MFERISPLNRLRPYLLPIGVALVSLLVLMILWPSASAPPLVSRWRAAPPMTQPEPQAPAGAQPASISGAAVATDLFDMQLSDGLYADQRQQLRGDLEAALAYDIARFGSGPSGRITAAMVDDGSCGLHGIAYTDVRNVQVFTCGTIGRERAVAIMAHEFVHQLAQDRYGPAHLHADMILLEGVATWGAGKYWLGGQPDFRSYVREQRRAGNSLPLATNYTGLGVGAMNTLYYQWASFVEFLINTYGREKFDQLYVTGASNPGSSDYAGVYGKSLAALEQEWIAWIDQ
jgi:hypothetical protein